MVPTKVKNFLPAIASELGIPQEHLEIMVSYYYKRNRQLLSSLGYLHIRFRHLGVMTIKGWELEKEIKKVRAYINKYDNPKLQDELRELLSIKEQWDIQEAGRKQVRETRNQYYADKEKGKEQ